jgi:tRNA(Ile)-lysidine synthase
LGGAFDTAAVLRGFLNSAKHGMRSQSVGANPDPLHCARRLPEREPKILLLAVNLVERVSQIIPRYNMLSAGNRVGVAVSGGADSVVLLHVLQRLISTLAIHLTVLHVNHGLRGEESDEDEQFVRKLAGKFGLEFVTRRLAPEPGNLEQEARRVRRDFFRNCRDQHKLDKIALGHTRSDQAETILYRFLRGSGITGLAGMRRVTEDGLIRPLLAVSRTEVRAWAMAAGIQWREDSSNGNEGLLRNLLRRKVIPGLAGEFNPNLEGVLAGTAEIAAAEEDYWHGQIEPLYRNKVKRCHLGMFCRVDALAREHPAVQRRLVRRAIADLRGDIRSIDLQHVDAVLDLCSTQEGHDRAVIPGVDAIRSFDLLLLARPGELNAGPRNYCVDITWGERVRLPFGSGEIELSVLKSDNKNCVNVKEEPQFHKEIADFDIDALTSHGSATCVQVRNCRPGDGLLRPGHQKPEKVKSLFQEFRVRLWRRRHWPVAVVNDEVFWVSGFGGASPYVARPDSREIARICFWPGEQFREL